jgi:hypothetical protein
VEHVKNIITNCRLTYSSITAHIVSCHCVSKFFFIDMHSITPLSSKEYAEASKNASRCLKTTRITDVPVVSASRSCTFQMLNWFLKSLSHFKDLRRMGSLRSQSTESSSSYSYPIKWGQYHVFCIMLR